MKHNGFVGRVEFCGSPHVLHGHYTHLFLLPDAVNHYYASIYKPAVQSPPPRDFIHYGGIISCWCAGAADATMGARVSSNSRVVQQTVVNRDYRREISGDVSGLRACIFILTLYARSISGLR